MSDCIIWLDETIVLRLIDNQLFLRADMRDFQISFILLYLTRPGSQALVVFLQKKKVRERARPQHMLGRITAGR
jgi:hypothetical protein